MKGCEYDQAHNAVHVADVCAVSGYIEQETTLAVQCMYFWWYAQVCHNADRHACVLWYMYIRTPNHKYYQYTSDSYIHVHTVITILFITYCAVHGLYYALLQHTTHHSLEEITALLVLQSSNRLLEPSLVPRPSPCF